MVLISFLFLSLFLLCGLLSISSEKLDYHSFEPPFNDVDSSGERIVNRHWRGAGTTVVNSNFIRLTPDRQSKKGALWSRKPLAVPSFSSVFKFRIAGQGKNFFGDGIALWIVQQGYYIEGQVHGFVEKFVGIGIIFDTFKNMESIESHRDVTVLINDGEKTFEMMTKDVKGCNINVRYHSDRADYSVSDASRAKVIVNETSFELYVDAKNTGEWVECLVLRNLSMPNMWVENSFVGMTATTGQLADNHDVISLSSYSDSKVMEILESSKAIDSKRYYPLIPSEPIENRINRLEDAANELYSKFAFFDHHVEHEIVAVNDHIESVILKLKNREDGAEQRIVNLEEIVRKEVEGTINSRIKAIEVSLDRNMDQKIHRKTNMLEQKLDSRTAETAAAAGMASAGSSESGVGICPCSSMPFYLSILFNVLACLWFFYLFRVLSKKHHLP